MSVDRRIHIKDNQRKIYGKSKNEPPEQKNYHEFHITYLIIMLFVKIYLAKNP
jgi:hypothetical protein